MEHVAFVGAIVIVTLVTYVAYILQTLDEFEFINGPIVLIDEKQLDNYKCCTYSGYMVRVTTTSKDAVHFKVPCYFSQISEPRKRRLLQRKARRIGSPLKSIEVIEAI